MFRRSEAEERSFAPVEPGEVRTGNGGADVTVVGQGARLEGNLVSAGSLRIDGQVKGKITAEGDVMLSPTSRVEADIQATNVLIAGAFKGSIVVTGKAELARGGHVEGDVTSSALVVAEGAVFSGQSIMERQVARKGPGRDDAAAAVAPRAEAVPAGEGAPAAGEGRKAPAAP